MIKKLLDGKSVASKALFWKSLARIYPPLRGTIKRLIKAEEEAAKAKVMQEIESKNELTHREDLTGLDNFTVTIQGHKNDE